MPSLIPLGAGIWMIGTGVPGVQSIGGALKVIGGVILVIAAFIGG
jgi:hypothetical protein